MINYQKMYAILCAAASEAMDLLQLKQNQSAYQCLQNALHQTEELYVTAEDDEKDSESPLTLFGFRDNMIDRN